MAFGTKLASSAAAATIFVILSAGPGLAAPSTWLELDGNIRADVVAPGIHDWANSGTGSPVNACSATPGVVNLSGSGGLFNCGSPGAGSAPPNPPVPTPAATADPSIISMLFIADPISSDTTACGTGDPTVFGGGLKNGADLNTFSFSTGSVPPKDDLGNVYAVSRTRADGHPEIFFAAERLVNNGDSHMDFEFLQSKLTRTAACSGTMAGDRTEGDLLLAVDFTIGGSLAGNSLYQWHCAAESGPQPPDGTVCNPTGATPVPHYQLITPLAGTLAFLVNAAITPCGGWVCRDSITGNSTQVAANDFMEGGIDLQVLPFSGCFNTFLPHTRTAQSFTSTLKDFAGPAPLSSCRVPAIATSSAPGGNAVAPSTTAGDSVTVGNGGAGLIPSGSVTFFLCGPGQTTSAGCPSGGSQVGASKPLSGGAASSDQTTATATAGTYCWRVEYVPDLASTGIYSAATHTDSSSECFVIAVATPAPTRTPDPLLPDTGGLPLQPLPALPLAAALAVAALTMLASRRPRSRNLAGIALAGLLVGGSLSAPVSTEPSPAQGVVVQLDQPDRHVQGERSGAVPAPAVAGPAAPAPRRGWRLVIPTIGIDAVIGPVGLDREGRMAAPGRLDSVGWYSPGPSPGQPGDAVIAGHLGFASEPAVFRDLNRLRPGDVFQVVSDAGKQLNFKVQASSLVSRAARPPDLFARTGPARVSLITCAGPWDRDQSTYSQRLIVEAVAIGQV